MFADRGMQLANVWLVYHQVMVGKIKHVFGVIKSFVVNYENKQYEMGLVVTKPVFGGFRQSVSL